MTELEKMTFVFIGYLFIIPKLSFSSLKRVQSYPQLKLADGLMHGNFLTKLVPIRNDKNEIPLNSFTQHNVTQLLGSKLKIRQSIIFGLLT